MGLLRAACANGTLPPMLPVLPEICIILYIYHWEVCTSYLFFDWNLAWSCLRTAHFCFFDHFAGKLITAALWFCASAIGLAVPWLSSFWTPVESQWNISSNPWCYTSTILGKNICHLRHHIIWLNLRMVYKIISPYSFPPFLGAGWGNLWDLERLCRKTPWRYHGRSSFLVDIC